MVYWLQGEVYVSGGWYYLAHKFNTEAANHPLLRSLLSALSQNLNIPDDQPTEVYRELRNVRTPVHFEILDPPGFRPPKPDLYGDRAFTAGHLPGTFA
jgi:hypothetical protein